MKHYYNVKSYARTPEIQELPSLIDIQLKSFEDFLYRGRLLELFDEINPIESFNGNLLLYFPGNIPEAREFGLKFWFEEPKYDEDACLERDMSYASPLHVRVALMNRAEGDEVITQDIFLGDFPLMTEKGTFIINGTERVVVSQLIRSPGVYFDVEEERATGRSLSNAKMIPDRGAWMEFETRKTDYITIKFNRKRTIPVTVLLRALAAVDDGLPPEMSPVKTGNDDEMRRLFADLDTDELHPYIESSLKNEPEWDVKKKQTIAEVALIEFYRRMRPGDPPTLDNARNYLEGQLFDQRRYDLERVGRHKLNQKRRDLVKKLEELGREGAIEVLGLKDEIDPEHRTMTKADIVALVAQMILINNGQGERNDIDHLGNRRVKTVGELIGNKLRIGLRRMERVVRERMSIREAEQLTPVALVNIRPIVAAVREFFGSSQLSQFMEQTNPLSELTHKRTLSALGPGGLRRERAGFDVRDVHHSHYGRICPIETPEGPNIGLIGRLASYARVNELGFIETPYRKVVNELPVVLTNKVRAPEDIVVSRKVSRSRKVTESLIGYESSGEVPTLEKSRQAVDNLNKIRNTSLKQSENALHSLGEELRGGGGVRASLQQIRGEAEKGKFPDGETIKQYRCKIDEPVRAYQETVRKLEREITQLQSHPEIVRILGDQAKVLDFVESLDELKGDTDRAIVGLEDMEAAISEGVTNKEEFNKAVAEALIGVNNLQERIPAIVRDVQRKIDANPLLSDEGVKSRIIVKKGDIIDADILKALKEHGREKVKVVSYVGNKALIGREVYDDINDTKGRTIVEMDTVIDADILNVLVEHGIKKVKVVTYVEEKIDNPDLIGRTVRDDIESVIVKEGTVIDAEIVKELREYGRKEVLVVEGLSIPTSVKEVKSVEVFTPNWVESDTNEYNLEKVSNKDLLKQVVAEDIEAVIAVAGTVIDATAVRKLKKHGIKEVKVVIYVEEKIDNPDLIGRTVSEEIVVSRKVTRSRKVTESLIGYKSSDDVEVATLEKSRQAVNNLNEIRNTSLKQSEDALHGLGKELRESDGVRASLQQIRNKVEKGEFPDGETIKQYRRKINEPVRAYQETIKTLERKITQLQSHPEIVRISGDQAKVLDFAGLLDELAGDTDTAIVGLEDMEAAISAGVTNKEEFNKAVAEALIGVNNLQERIPAIVRDVQRKIDANPLLSDEGVKSRIIIVKKGDIIDANILKALKEHGIKKVKIEDDKEEIIAEAGTVINAEILEKLVEQGIKEVKVETKTYTAKKVDDPDLIGCKAADDIEAVIVAGTVIDAEILEKLVEQDIEKVKTVSYVGNKALIGRSVYDTIKGNKGNVIVKASAKINARILKKLVEQDIKEVKVETYTAKKVDDPDLIGYKAADDIEAVIVEERTVIDAKVVRKLKKHGIEKVPVVPFATYDIEYLSADTEDRYRIAQANSHLDERNQFVSRRVSARHDQKFLTVPRDRLDYMDIAPRQIVGISAALIPFLSHDDANRALMGSNMQRQAVPLLTPDVSVVSTGMESQAASDSGQVLVSDIEAEVVSVQGHRVIVKTKEGEELVYPLRKYDRSNQSTCIDQRPLVRKGDTIKPGDVIADSSSTYEGRLALGHDVLTCFLSWDGGNYEDALLVSEDMLRNDKFTSIHIEKHEIEARDTKLGPEEITYDIPNVGEEALKDLDERGIVRIGAEVGPNDILVGKITPKGEKELSPEEKLLRAIFGEQAREVKDSSLRLPHGDRGKVVDVKIFTRDEYPDLPAGVEKMVRVSVAQRRKLTVGDKMSGRHGNKGVISKIVPIEDMPYIEGGVPVEIILNPLGVPGRMNIGQILELHLGWAADRLGFRAVTPVFDGAREDEIRADLGRAWMIDWAWKYITERAWENAEHLAEMGQMKLEEFDDDMHVICAYLVHRVGESGEYDNEAIILERDEIYVRRVAVAEVLREFGYAPDEVMVYNNEGLSNEERDRRDQNALRVSLCLWIGQNAEQEVELGDDLEIRDLFKIADQVMFETGSPVPHYGKQRLYDGRTGEPFDRDVAVGYVHMLKLAHLVEDKAHARSTGPYSLVTQQPLGGKAQFGGQRFGEMEVWALEAYGAAYILQEMLTVKSDDVQGRVKTYESIVKGEDIEEPGIPTSFRVLVKELQSLGLAVEAITSSGDVIRFGKDDEQARRPQPATGLLRLGSN